MAHRLDALGWKVKAVPASSPNPSSELTALQKLAVAMFGPRLGVSIDETAQACGVGRDTVYGWINDHRLTVTKIGKRTIVLLPSLLQLMAENVVAGRLVELAATEHHRRHRRSTSVGMATAPMCSPADIRPPILTDVAKRRAKPPPTQRVRTQRPPRQPTDG